MNYIYRVTSKEYITKILSEQKISIDYVDLASQQTFDEFVEFTNPKIVYKADDFLFSLTKINQDLLSTKKWIELSKTEQFGWYYGRIHKSEIQLFDATNPKKFRTLTENNPQLKVNSFDKFRNYYRPIKVTNILNGAFGLAYTVFKADYDNFFRKIKVHKNQWVIEKSTLDRTDYPIITQIFLYDNAETQRLNKSLLENIEFKGVRIFGFFLEQALSYFIHNDYSMINFLSYMITTFEKYEEMKIFADDFKLLNDRYVKKGLTVDTKNPITIATKEFLDLAKTESKDLGKLLENEELNKTAIFLLGMLNLGDRIDEQFSFDTSIPAIVEITMCNIVDIQVSDKNVVITFDEREINNNRNNKFNLVKNYFKELHIVNNLTDEVNHIAKISESLAQIKKSLTTITELDNSSQELTKKIEKSKLQRENLIDRAKEHKWFDNKYNEWINSENEKENLNKATMSLIDEIAKLKDRNNDLINDETDLEKELSGLDAKINTLKQTQKLRSKELNELIEIKENSIKPNPKKTTEVSSKQISAPIKKKNVQKRKIK